MEKKIECIGENIKICVSEDHTFGTDAILLFDFSEVRKNDSVIDLGTGCGIMAVLSAFKSGKEIYGIDIQESACLLASESARLSEIDDRLTILNEDMKNLPSQLNGRFSLCLCNPPYYKVDGGYISKNKREAIARQEICADVYDAAYSASRLLKYGGRFCICHKPERLCDIMEAFRKNKIEPKRMRLVCSGENKAPWLVLVEGKKGGKPGMIVENNLVVKPGEETTDSYMLYKGEKK